MNASEDGPSLYLLVGYPGSGKTTVARFISEQRGAVHVWADQERHKLFGHPSHQAVEGRKLYKILDTKVAQLLDSGQSVIYDTNFNFRRDRDRLHTIANQYGAVARVVWVQTDKDVAWERARTIEHAHENNFGRVFPEREFERMTRNLEPPKRDEQPIILDGTKITADYVRSELG